MQLEYPKYLRNMKSNRETTTFTDSIVFDVIKEIAERSEAGLAKYGTTMDRTDLIASDWVQHAYEEALDMAIYLKRLRKDMLAMEEELRAFKTQNMIKDKIEEEKNKPLVLSFKSGTKFAYKVIPQPNKVYTDEEPVIRKKYNWHR